MGEVKYLEQLKSKTALFLVSTEEYLLRNEASKALDVFQGEDTEFTLIEGPVPDIALMIAAAGTISFFESKRVIYIKEISISSMSQDDIKEFCSVIESAENSVFVITALLKDDKSAGSKKELQISESVKKDGFAIKLEKPSVRDLQVRMSQKASSLGATLSNREAQVLIETCGNNIFLLENEVEKLAAACNYKDITQKLIEEIGTRNIDTDTFKMIDALQSKNAKRVYTILNELIDLKETPIAISAALNASFIDIYRMKIASKAGVGYKNVHKEMHYKGSDYRLKKAEEKSRKYSQKQICYIINILAKLDKDMKSTGADNLILLQTALQNIMLTAKG